MLGQHVAPIPAGMLGLRSGPAFAASDSLQVTLHGAGGHGSRPEATVDPVVMAAATFMRLQTMVSREVAGTDTAVVTVGASNAGTKANIIPDDAELLLNIRSYDEAVRGHLLDGHRADRARRGRGVGAHHGRPTSSCSSRRPRWSTTRMPWSAPDARSSRSSAPGGWSTRGR